MIPPHARDSEVEDAFEFHFAKEGDFDGTLALGVAKVNFSAEPLAETIFEVGT